MPDLMKTSRARVYSGWYSVIFACLMVGVLTFLLHFSVNWPRADDFSLLDWYNNFFIKKTLGVSGILAVHVSSHPLATEAVICLAIFAMIGINFKLLIAVNCLLVAVSVVTLAKFVMQQNGITPATLLGGGLLFLVFFHPFQVSHFFWSFELCWFLINCVLVANAVLLESDIRVKMPAIALLCLLGTFSSALGTVLWAMVVLQLCLQSFRTQRKNVIFFGIATLASMYYVARLTGSDVHATKLPGVSHLVLYLIQMLGTIFFDRDHSRVTGHGCVIVSMVCISVIQSVRLYQRSKIQRVAIVLMTGSIIFLTEFAVGRSQYGIDWALSEFHMASLLVPLLASIVVMSVNWADRFRDGSNTKRVLALSPCIYILVSVILSFSPALAEAKDIKLQLETARHFACKAVAEPYLVYGLNFGMPNKDLYLRTRHLLEDNCNAPDSKSTRELLRYPALFARLIERQPDLQPALDNLWQVYLVHFDLSRAFPPNDPKYANTLLQFAINNARTGSNYETEKLKPFEPIFVRLSTWNLAQ